MNIFMIKQFELTLNLLEDEMSITYVEVCDIINQFNNLRSAYVHTHTQALRYKDGRREYVVYCKV